MRNRVCTFETVILYMVLTYSFLFDGLLYVFKFRGRFVNSIDFCIWK